jgi:hypothetical protein
LGEGNTYQYRAVVMAGALKAVGDTLTATIPVTPPPQPPLTPTGLTTIASSISTSSIVNTGAHAIQRYSDVQWYGMEYRAICSVDINVTPTLLTNVSNAGTVCNVFVCGPSYDTYVVNTAAAWITPSAPVAPSPSGTINTLTIAANTGLARSGVVCYTPTIGTTKCVIICQLCGVVPINVCTCRTSQSGCGTSSNAYGCFCITPTISVPTDCYDITFHTEYGTVGQTSGSYVWTCILCNNVGKYYHCLGTIGCEANCCAGPFTTTSGAQWTAIVCAHKAGAGMSSCPNGGVGIACITDIVGSYTIGPVNLQLIYTC